VNLDRVLSGRTVNSSNIGGAGNWAGPSEDTFTGGDSFRAATNDLIGEALLEREAFQKTDCTELGAGAATECRPYRGVAGFCAIHEHTLSIAAISRVGYNRGVLRGSPRK